LQRGKAVKINNPVNVWKGSFRDETPVDRNHKPWKPNGLAASLYNTGSCGLISSAKNCCTFALAVPDVCSQYKLQCINCMHWL